MTIALTFIILLVTTVAILVLRMIRPTFAYHWMVAVLGALLIWPMLLFSNVSQQTVIKLALWEPHSIFPASPAFFMDQFSWSFSLALATLLLSSILIGAACSSDPAYLRPTWLDFAVSLVLTAAGLLAICAGNLLTLLMVWALLDLVELVSRLSKVEGEHANQRVVLTFSSRIISQVFLFWAVITAHSNLLELSILSLDPAVTPFLLLAVGFRLDIPSLSSAGRSQVTLHSGHASTLNLISLASSLVLLCRVASVGVPSSWTSPLLVIVSLAALFGSVKWITQADGQEGQTGWIIALSALAFAAALRMQPGACQSFGLALLLGGGLLFLFNIRVRWLLPLLLVGALSISGLPWTPTWSIVQLYAAPFRPSLVLLLVSQGLVLAGYLRFALQTAQKPSGLQRWVWALYIWGLALLPLAFLIIARWSLRSSQELLQPHPGLLESWPGLVSLFMAVIFILPARGKFQLPGSLLRALRAFQNLDWLYRLIRSLPGTARFFFRWSNTLLESQAGILWAFLLLVLLLTLFSQSNLGR